MNNFNEQKNNKKERFKFEVKILLSIFFVTALFVVANLIGNNNRNISNLPISSIFPIITNKPIAKDINNVKNFSSEQDFKDYLEAAAKRDIGYSGGFGLSTMASEALSAPGMMTKNMADAIGGGSAPDRISGTNVQVIGIDEPDIVKTDGKEIYFSSQQQYYYPMMRNDVGTGITLEENIMIAPDSKIMPPYPYPTPQAATKIIKAFPPADLKIDGKIEKQGDLLLNNNILVIFPSQQYYYGSDNQQEITAYDVSNPKSPIKKWSVKLENNTSVVTSRLKDGKIYLITRSNIDQNRPCPIKPMSIDGVDLNIRCAEIYHPIVPVPTDTTFIASLINSSTGKVEKSVSFVGSSGSTVIYVSENAIYATYTYNESIVKFFSGFLNENKNFFPAYVVEKINKLNTYDISESAKMTELSLVMEKYQSSLSSDDRLKLENEMKNRMSDYYKAHNRELEKTGIVKINTDNFTIAANGEVPGHLLNNFSMDEYQGNLRVASTIGSRWGIFSGIGSGESVSDVTILDKNLDQIGSVKDLGKTEQIYSVRFIEDKGYVVTFRQIDPFYILDLANPRKPQMTGELKIPGYSSYLHPLDTTHILGVGMESGKVKISLFDVTDKTNPIELDKYLLDEYWTEVSNNYHAFLLDKKHNIFFLPGSKGGYAFSYYGALDGLEHAPQASNYEKGFKLKLEKAVSQNSVKRAIYLNDYLYIIGDDKITVLNELDWQKVNELDLTR